MNYLFRLSFQFIVASIGIILIGALPSLFQVKREYVNGEFVGDQLFNGSGYIEGIKVILKNMANINEMTYSVKGTVRDLFPHMLEPYLYSFTVFISALCLGILSAVVLTYITMLLHRKIIKFIKFLVFIFESIPDILIIIAIQGFIISLYQKTNILFLNIAAVPGEKIYVLPILTLAILPTVQFYKILILIFEEELEEHYVELARGKGLKQSWILLNHVLRNAAISMFYHSKSILWFMLSNLLVLEYLFNIFGMTGFLMDYMTPEIFTIGLYMIFIPIFIIYAIGETYIQRLTKKEVASI
jgi:peptide/nickel transport system permease protein